MAEEATEQPKRWVGPGAREAGGAKQDMRRATMVLEAAARDIGDEFLQYLYGMVALHLEEQSGNHRRIEPRALNDPKITMAAKMIVKGRGDRPSRRG